MADPRPRGHNYLVIAEGLWRIRGRGPRTIQLWPRGYGGSEGGVRKLSTRRAFRFLHIGTAPFGVRHRAILRDVFLTPHSTVNWGDFEWLEATEHEKRAVTDAVAQVFVGL